MEKVEKDEKKNKWQSVMLYHVLLQFPRNNFTFLIVQGKPQIHITLGHCLSLQSLN